MKALFAILFAMIFSLNVGAVSSTSIYNLDSTWINQDGKKVALTSLKGKVRIVSMVFTRCTSACPMLVGDVKMILSKLPAAQRDKVAVDLFSFDYEKDTPEALNGFVKKMKIDNSQWSAYTGSKTAISDLAAVLGVQYKKLEGGAYVHSNNIILINAEGEIVKSIEGYDASVSEFIELLKANVKI